MINITTVNNKMPQQDPEVRICNFEESALGYDETTAVAEAMRCLKCRKKPCMELGCPVHNDIPGFIGKVAEGKFEEAYQILQKTTNLPAVCGRVCPQYEQCEGHCVRGTRGEPVAIGALERFVADWHRENVGTASSEPAQKKGKKVAVIGSGPAGSTCAGDLAEKGHMVTIFEKEKVVGGVLEYGIPQFRLPKDIVAAEIKGLTDKGVTIKTGKSLGKDFSVDKLLTKEKFDAVFIGNGAGIPTTMNIPGEDKEGVILASDYLMRINVEHGYDPSSKDPLPKAKRIAVIGGGNVAMDACRSAVRTGAEKVYVIYRRSEAEMPADPSEVFEAREEGVEFMFLTNPVEVKGKDRMGVITPLPRLHHGGSLITQPLFLGQRLTTHAPGMIEIKPVDVGYYFVYIVCEDLRVHSLNFKH